jgi:hypothetical protein
MAKMRAEDPGQRGDAGFSKVLDHRLAEAEHL